MKVSQIPGHSVFPAKFGAHRKLPVGRSQIRLKMSAVTFSQPDILIDHISGHETGCYHLPAPGQKPYLTVQERVQGKSLKPEVAGRGIGSPALGLFKIGRGAVEHGLHLLHFPLRVCLPQYGIVQFPPVLLRKRLVSVFSGGTGLKLQLAGHLAGHVRSLRVCKISLGSGQGSRRKLRVQIALIIEIIHIFDKPVVLFLCRKMGGSPFLCPLFTLFLVCKGQSHGLHCLGPYDSVPGRLHLYDYHHKCDHHQYHAAYPCYHPVLHIRSNSCKRSKAAG